MIERLKRLLKFTITIFIGLLFVTEAEPTHLLAAQK